jgi:hypothetical protein
MGCVLPMLLLQASRQTEGSHDPKSCLRKERQPLLPARSNPIKFRCSFLSPSRACHPLHPNQFPILALPSFLFPGACHPYQEAAAAAAHRISHPLASPTQPSLYPLPSDPPCPSWVCAGEPQSMALSLSHPLADPLAKECCLSSLAHASRLSLARRECSALPSSPPPPHPRPSPTLFPHTLSPPSPLEKPLSCPSLPCLQAGPPGPWASWPLGILAPGHPGPWASWHPGPWASWHPNP